MGLQLIYIDWENIYINIRDDYQAPPNPLNIFETLEVFCRKQYRIKVYGDWTRSPFQTARRMKRHDPHYQFITTPSEKNGADQVMKQEILKDLQIVPQFVPLTHLVVVSGDGGFIPTVNEIRSRQPEIHISVMFQRASRNNAWLTTNVSLLIHLDNFYEKIANIPEVFRVKKRRAELNLS